MPEPDLFEQQRTVVRAFHLLMEERQRVEAEAAARQASDQLEANETLDRIRGAAEHDLANAQAEAHHLHDTQHQVADTELANALQENEVRVTQAEQRVEAQYQTEYLALDESLAQALREADIGLARDEAQINAEFENQRGAIALGRSKAEEQATTHLKIAESALHEPGFDLSAAGLQSLRVYVETARLDPNVEMDDLKSDTSTIKVGTNGDTIASADPGAALGFYSKQAQLAASETIAGVRRLMTWRQVRKRRLQWLGGVAVLVALVGVAVFGWQQAEQQQYAEAIDMAAAQANTEVLFQATVVARPPIQHMAVYADQGWQDSGIYVRAGEALTVSQTSGSWSYCVPNACPYVDGQGIPDSLNSDANVVSPCPHAALIVQFEDEQSHITKVECMQKEYAGLAPASGMISFRINDSVIDDNAGSLGIVLRVGPTKDANTTTTIAATATAESSTGSTAPPVSSAMSTATAESSTRTTATAESSTKTTATAEGSARTTATAVSSVMSTATAVSSTRSTTTAFTPARPTATVAAKDFQVVKQDNYDYEDAVIGDDDAFRHSITAGRDRWEMKSGNCAGWWFWGGDKSGERFSLAQDVDIVSGPAQAEISLMFRRTGNDHYLISLRDNQFTVRRYQQDHFVPLVDWTTTDAIHRDQMNHLLVVGDGAHFQFFINDQPVGSVEDATLPEGVIGIHMYGSCPTDQPAVFEFDNLELRAP